METPYRATAFEMREVRRYWGWFLALGVAMVILGLLCLSSAVIATLLTTVLLGVVAILAGAVLLASAFWADSGWGSLLRVALGILFVLAGWSLLTRPVLGALTLTAIIGWFLILSGIVHLIIALAERLHGWGWSAINGVVTLLLGVLLVTQWPLSGLVAIGLFLGIDLLMNGALWVTVALGVRSAPRPPSTTSSAMA
ncbi:MAG TPA: HdeD family acid-resistance protein [Ktedonobacterales bacterium]|nr:HdeD family acid-resistance protein [Ktedonobacterales bacterium]